MIFVRVVNNNRLIQCAYAYMYKGQKNYMYRNFLSCCRGRQINLICTYYFCPMFIISPLDIHLTRSQINANITGCIALHMLTTLSLSLSLSLPPDTPNNPDKPAERTDAQTNALCMALVMFSLILDRVLALTREAVASVRQMPPPSSLPTAVSNNDDDATAAEDVDICLAFNDDARILLPAIKVWCDWLLANCTVWNPPPSLHAFNVHPVGNATGDATAGSVAPDPWRSLADFATMLEHIKPTKRYINIQARDRTESELVRLPEDIALLGFAPLDQHNDLQPVYCDRIDDLEIVHTVYRVKRIVFLCTKCFTQFDPAVLRRHESGDGTVVYRSVAAVVPADDDAKEATRRRSSNANTAEDDEDELLLESFSDDDLEAQTVDGGAITEGAAEAVKTSAASGSVPVDDSGKMEDFKIKSAVFVVA